MVCNTVFVHRCEPAMNGKTKRKYVLNYEHFRQESKKINIDRGQLMAATSYK